MGEPETRQEGRKSIWAWGCLFLLIGIVVGALVVGVVLLLWPATHAGEIASVDTGKLPSGYDVEVRITEAFLNQAVADELAAGPEASLGRIVLDVQPKNLLIATLEGAFDLGGLLRGANLTIQSIVLLEVQDGALAARLQQVQVGPLTIDRESLPAFLLSSLESMEGSLVRSVNERFRAEGMEIVGIMTDEKTLILGLAPVQTSQ